MHCHPEWKQTLNVLYFSKHTYCSHVLNIYCFSHHNVFLHIWISIVCCLFSSFLFFFLQKFWTGGKDQILSLLWNSMFNCYAQFKQLQRKELFKQCCAVKKVAQRNINCLDGSTQSSWTVSLELPNNVHFLLHTLNII